VIKPSEPYGLWRFFLENRGFIPFLRGFLEDFVRRRLPQRQLLALPAGCGGRFVWGDRHWVNPHPDWADHHPRGIKKAAAAVSAGLAVLLAARAAVDRKPGYL